MMTKKGASVRCQILKVLIPSHFYRYSTDPLWIWYDQFGNPSEKSEIPEFTLKLMEKGVLYEKAYISNIEMIEVLSEDPETAFKETIQLMQQGVERIYQGCIQMEDQNILYRGRPDLLEKRSGNSVFGDWYYTPIDIKFSSRVKDLHRNQLTFYSLILKKIQNYFPSDVGIINKQGRSLFTINPEDVSDVQMLIESVHWILSGNKPELKISSESKNSPWFKCALREAETKQDIALIYKLDARVLSQLRAKGIRTLSDIVDVDINQLLPIKHATKETLEKKQLQAKALLENKIIYLTGQSISFPETTLNIYFDIEGNPFIDNNLRYLFGILITGDPDHLYAKSQSVRFCKNESDTYFIYFLAENAEEEKKAWDNFIEWINLLPSNCAIYHYANYEKTSLKDLINKYGTTSSALQTFQTRLVDLYKIINETIILPVYFYSIKDVAKSNLINFEWRTKNASGVQSIFLYEEWLATKNRAILEQIVDYNEDDLYATKAVHDFLKRLKK